MATKYVYELNDNINLKVYEDTITIHTDHGTVLLTKEEAEQLALVIIRNT
jgi:hypothetical protein